jgi:hypothetical protein
VLHNRFADDYFLTSYSQAETETSSAGVKKEEKPKSPSLLAKLLAPFKGEKKVKTPKVKKEEKVCIILHLIVYFFPDSVVSSVGGSCH